MNGTIPTKRFLVRQPSLTSHCYCHGFFSHSQRPSRSVVRKAPFPGRKACNQFWGFSVWHAGMLYRIPLMLSLLIFCGRGFYVTRFTEEVMLFVWRTPRHYNKVLSWDSSNLLSFHPQHSNTASQTLGLYILMLSGCYSTLGVFEKMYPFFIGYLILLRISLGRTGGDFQGHSFPVKKAIPLN